MSLLNSKFKHRSRDYDVFSAEYRHDRSDTYHRATVCRWDDGSCLGILVDQQRYISVARKDGNIEALMMQMDEDLNY